MESLRFLVDSIANLGPRLGFRYWKVYRACRKDPAVIVRWEKQCRLMSDELSVSDPVTAKFLGEWADLLSECPR